MTTISWEGPRRPLEDDAADEVRRDRYWRWASTQEPRDDAPPLEEPTVGVTLHRVADHAQADFEAGWMGHSVGYNFDHYSAVGEILSLRRKGIPFVTLLASDGMVVHAVRAHNEMITDGDRVVLQAVCDRRGWTMPSNEALQGRGPDPERGRDTNDGEDVDGPGPLGSVA